MNGQVEDRRRGFLLEWRTEQTSDGPMVTLVMTNRDNPFGGRGPWRWMMRVPQREWLLAIGLGGLPGGGS